MFPHQSNKKETDMIAASSTNINLTAAKSAGLLQLSVHYLNTPTSFEILLDLLRCHIKATCANIIRATVFDLEPKHLDPSVAF